MVLQVRILVSKHLLFNNLGVKIGTSCGPSLRLTPEHLVYTQNGLVAAGHVSVGDTLFQGEKEIPCQVTSVFGNFLFQFLSLVVTLLVGESNQKYFGLNCEESVVFSNGYKVSTFGIYHDIPALWMKYSSKLIGILPASRIGDGVASFLSSLGFI